MRRSRRVWFSMRTIELTNGMLSTIDDVDFERFSCMRWFYNGYASTQVNGRTTSLHRLIMNAMPGTEIDHINGDKLDNRRENLRFVTRSQNMQNVRTLRSDSTTRVRNVFIEKRTGRYVVRVQLNGRSYYCGSFILLNDAAEVAKQSRRKYFTHAPESAST